MGNVACTIGVLYYGMLCQLLFMANQLLLSLEGAIYISLPFHHYSIAAK